MAAVEATGSRNSAAREARRRRILERGSDRLALITGRIESLPPDPSESTPASQIPTDSAPRDDVASSPSSQNRESDVGPTQRVNLSSSVRPSPQNNERSRSIAARAANLLGVEKEFSDISSAIMQDPSCRSQREQQSHHPLPTAAQASSAVAAHPPLFTAAKVSSAAAASENIRMCFSVTAAVLVILSYIGFPFTAAPIIRNVVIPRPVYLLFLTNISVVLAWVFLGKSSVGSISGRSRFPTLGGNGLVDQFGKALESALLVQKVVSALFIDFSVYAIVLICGLCVVRTLGW